MPVNMRRRFLKNSALAVGWTALAAGGIRSAGAAGPVGTDTPAAERPPTRRFLDAVAEGDMEAVQRWLAQDPGLLHARDEAGRGAFALALLHGHLDVAELLRARGYEPDLHESALALDWPRFESLAAVTPGLVNQPHPLGGTAMYAAAIGGAGTQIWRVYRYGGDPDANPRGARGYSALRAALDYSDLSVAELTCASLLGNNADPNVAQADGSSALHRAAERGSTAVVEILIRKGARVDAEDAQGRTPLELAEANGRREAAALLREHRAVPRDHSTSRTAYDVEGRPYRAGDLTAFSILERIRVVAAAHFDLDGVREAVERHPELVHAVATTGEVGVEGCAHTGRTPIVDYLLERGAPYSLPTAVMRNDLGRARALLEEDPQRIHERGPHDFALLWYPVIGRDLIDMAGLLLEYGAEIDRQHWLGTTALHYAALGGQTEMIALLIEHGADVNRVGRKFDPAGQTPLQIALGQGHEDVAKLLRDRGAV